MPTTQVTSHRRRRVTAVASALALIAVAWPGPGVAGAATSPAVDAAQAEGTPVITPPPKPRVKPLTCRVTRRVRGCVARRTTCATKAGVRTCRRQTARCRLVGRSKRCTIITITCTRRGTRRERCRRTSVRGTSTQAFAVLASQAIPRFLARRTALPAAAVTLVSSRPGSRAAPAMIPVATSSRTSAAGVGAGIGALALASVLMALILLRRRPGGDG